jgi:hypothetical protein
LPVGLHFIKRHYRAAGSGSRDDETGPTQRTKWPRSTHSLVLPPNAAIAQDTPDYVLGCLNTEWNKAVCDAFKGDDDAAAQARRDLGFYPLMLRLLAFLESHSYAFGEMRPELDLVERLAPATTLERPPPPDQKILALSAGKVRPPAEWESSSSAKRALKHLKLVCVIPVHIMWMFTFVLDPRHRLRMESILDMIDFIEVTRKQVVSERSHMFQDEDEYAFDIIAASVEPLYHASTLLREFVVTVYNAGILCWEHKMPAYDRRVSAVLTIVERSTHAILAAGAAAAAAADDDDDDDDDDDEEDGVKDDAATANVDTDKISDEDEDEDDDEDEDGDEDGDDDDDDDNDDNIDDATESGAAAATTGNKRQDLVAFRYPFALYLPGSQEKRLQQQNDSSDAQDNRLIIDLPIRLHLIKKQQRSSLGAGSGNEKAPTPQRWPLSAHCLALPPNPTIALETPDYVLGCLNTEWDQAVLKALEGNNDARARRDLGFYPLMLRLLAFLDSYSYVFGEMQPTPLDLLKRLIPAAAAAAAAATSSSSRSKGGRSSKSESGSRTRPSLALRRHLQQSPICVIPVHMIWMLTVALNPRHLIRLELLLEQIDLIKLHRRLVVLQRPGVFEKECGDPFKAIRDILRSLDQSCAMLRQVMLTVYAINVLEWERRLLTHERRLELLLVAVEQFRETILHFDTAQRASAAAAAPAPAAAMTTTDNVETPMATLPRRSRKRKTREDDTTETQSAQPLLGKDEDVKTVCSSRKRVKLHAAPAPDTSDDFTGDEDAMEDCDDSLKGYTPTTHPPGTKTRQHLADLVSFKFPVPLCLRRNKQEQQAQQNKPPAVTTASPLLLRLPIRLHPVKRRLCMDEGGGDEKALAARRSVSTTHSLAVLPNATVSPPPQQQQQQEEQQRDTPDYVLGCLNTEWNEAVLAAFRGDSAQARNFNFHSLMMRLLCFLESYSHVFGEMQPLGLDLLEQLVPATALEDDDDAVAATAADNNNHWSSLPSKSRKSALLVGKIKPPAKWWKSSASSCSKRALDQRLQSICVVPVHIIWMFTFVLHPQHLLPFDQILRMVELITAKRAELVASGPATATAQTKEGQEEEDVVVVVDGEPSDASKAVTTLRRALDHACIMLHRLMMTVYETNVRHWEAAKTLLSPERRFGLLFAAAEQLTDAMLNKIKTNTTEAEPEASATATAAATSITKDNHVELTTVNIQDARGAFSLPFAPLHRRPRKRESGGADDDDDDDGETARAESTEVVVVEEDGEEDRNGD